MVLIKYLTALIKRIKKPKGINNFMIYLGIPFGSEDCSKMVTEFRKYLIEKKEIIRQKGIRKNKVPKMFNFLFFFFENLE